MSELQYLDKYAQWRMLSQLGISFDHLGVFCCFFIKVKMALQQLAFDSFDYDIPVPDGVAKEWKA